jgi:putative membrane protein
MNTRIAALALATIALPLGALAQTSTDDTTATQSGNQGDSQADTTSGNADATATTSTTATSAPVQISSTADFVPLAMSGNMFEVESSRIARDKAQSGAVKEFAARMIEDHKAAGERMKDAVEADGVDMPKTMSRTQAAQLQTLTEAQPADFDAAYIQAQVAAHEEAVALFTACTQSCNDGQVKSLAVELLPKLQEHLKMAQGLVSQ